MPNFGEEKRARASRVHKPVGHVITKWILLHYIYKLRVKVKTLRKERKQEIRGKGIYYLLSYWINRCRSIYGAG